jgi:hypothetical protein
MLTYTATRPLDAVLDKDSNQIELRTAIADNHGQEFCLTMSKTDFQESLTSLWIAAKRYGIQPPS